MENDKTAVADTAAQIDLALCRATLYSAIALGFRVPSGERLTRLGDGENAATFAYAAERLDPQGASGLAACVRRVAEGAGAGAGFLGGLHSALFGHTVRGPVPPYETEYGNQALFQQAQELGDVMGFYGAFGLTLKPGEYERADHVSCECEFLSFLGVKEAYALDRGETEAVGETRKAYRLFLKDHFARFFPSFAQKIQRTPGADFYAALAELCLRFVTQESARLGVDSGPLNLPLRPAADDGAPIACGTGTDCMTMPGACGPERDQTV
jgi:TorA maturation chaperone TorD